MTAFIGSLPYIAAASPFNSAGSVSRITCTALVFSRRTRAATNPSPPLFPLPQKTTIFSALRYAASTCSATAVPAFSISVSEATPKRSLVTRSMARISAAVTIFIRQSLVVRRWSSAKTVRFRRRPKTGDQRATIKQKGPPRRAEGLRMNHQLCFRLFTRRQRLHPAMLLTVGEVHNQPNRQPADQTNPVPHPQLGHHVSIRDYAEDWNQWHPRRPERTRLRRIGVPQHHNRDRDDYEGEQRPDIHHLADLVDRRNAAYDCGQQAHQNRVLPRRAELGMDCGEKLPGQEAIVGHGVENPGLPEQHHQHHAGQARQHTGYGDVQNRTDGQRSDHSNRQIALRIFRLLRRGRNRIETDIGEEYVGRARSYPGESVGSVCATTRSPVGPIDVVSAQRDHKQNHRDLDYDDAGVKPRALFDTHDQNRRDHQGNEKGRKVKSNFGPE